MPISTAHYSIGTARSLIVEPQPMSQHVCIHNHEHASNSTVYIGASDVTVGNGIHAQATLTSQVIIGPGDALYAIADTEGCELHVMVIKQD